LKVLKEISDTWPSSRGGGLSGRRVDRLSEGRFTMVSQDRVVSINLFRPEMNRNLVFGRVGNRLLKFLVYALAFSGVGEHQSQAHQVIVDASVELPLSLPALP
jgi:hypothetical protein